MKKKEVSEQEEQTVQGRYTDLLCLAFKCTSDGFVLVTVNMHILKINRKNICIFRCI